MTNRNEIVRGRQKKKLKIESQQKEDRPYPGGGDESRSRAKIQNQWNSGRPSLAGQRRTAGGGRGGGSVIHNNRGCAEEVQVRIDQGKQGSLFQGFRRLIFNSD